MSLATIYSFIGTLITINTVLALVTIFRKPRSIASILAWFMFLVFYQESGFLGYLFLGRGLDRTTTRRFEEETNITCPFLAKEFMKTMKNLDQRHDTARKIT